MLVQGASEVLQTTWSAVQASISVILVLLYGYLARACHLLSEEGERNTSKISVTLFLPALLFSEIGPLASWENLKQYWVIIIYALFFQLCSFLVGTLGVRVFRMPQWIVPCMVFNNVTSLPLLLLSSLADTGTLKPLMGKGEDMDELLSRGKVYLLIHALVCNLTRFGFGPYMLEPPKSSSDSNDGEDEDKPKRSHRHWAWTYSESPHKATPIHKHIHASLTTALPAQQLPSAYPAVQPYHPQSESSPLLYQTRVEGRRAKHVFLIVWDTAKDWLNPPLVGGMAAIIGGVVPFLHKAIFGESSPLKPVAKSISNLGDLYTVLQMFVLGAHLKSKRGSRPPVWPLIYLFVYRFAIMPVITGATVFGVRRLLDGKIMSDPVLDFAMMIAPVGPPALTLAAIVEMSNADEGTDTAVAQTIVLSYILTPLISASVTGALDIVQRIHA